VETVFHPGFGSVVRYDTTTLSDDPDTQTAQVVGIMSQYASEDATSPEIRGDLESVLGAGWQDRLDKPTVVERLYGHVKGKIQFLPDITMAQPVVERLGSQVQWTPVVEVLIRPRDMSVMCMDGSCRRAGDCDDFSMYLASLLLAAGIPCNFVTVAADARAPEQFSHVYVAAYPGGYASRERVPLDASHGACVGWEVENRFGKRQEWPVGGSGLMRTLVAVAIAAMVIKYLSSDERGDD